jgi:hypothetical protein
MIKLIIEKPDDTTDNSISEKMKPLYEDTFLLVLKVSNHLSKNESYQFLMDRVNTFIN